MVGNHGQDSSPKGEDSGPLKPGNVVDNYRVVSSPEFPCPYKIGAFKYVYVVEADPVGPTLEEHAQRYALKVFKPYHEITSPSSLQNMKYLDGDRILKFFNEVRRLRDACPHENIANIVHAGRYNIGDSDENQAGLLYFVEDFVEGKTLKQIIDEEHGKPDGFTNPGFVEFTIRTFHQLAKALYHLHSQGMAHLDVKAENVLVRSDASRTVVLTDFGNASLLLDKDYYQEGSILYRAPEQLRWKKPRAKRGKSRRALPKVDERADTWAFGVLLNEFLTGQYAFVTSNPDWSSMSAEEHSAAKKELKNNILNRRIHPPSRFNPQIKTGNLDQLVINAMQRPPKKRPRMKTLYHSLSRMVGRLSQQQ